MVQVVMLGEPLVDFATKKADQNGYLKAAFPISRKKKRFYHRASEVLL